MEREQLLKVMVPVGVIAVLAILVGFVIALNSGTPATSLGDLPPPPPQEGSQTPTPQAAATPKFDFPLDGPEWKDLGAGLKAWDVTEGTGETCPSLAEKPSVVPVMHYTGWLTNGKVFDSSKPKGKPLDMRLSQLIAGWQKGVPGMRVGGVRRLLIPPSLGYGANGQGPIPGGATLVFEMELIRVQ